MPSPTPPPDATGPLVSVTPSVTDFSSDGGAACAGFVQQVTITVTLTDPSPPVAVTGVTWSAGGLSGTATPTGPNAFRVGPIASTHSGAIPMVVLVTAVDGVGNRTTNTITLNFRQIAESCIG